MSAVGVHAGIVTLAGQLACSAGVGSTVKLEVHVDIDGQKPTPLVALSVKLTVPPKHISLYTGREAMLLVGLHPSVTLKPDNHVAYSEAIIAAGVHAGTVTLAGQCATTGVFGATVKVDVHVDVDGQKPTPLVALRVKLTVPPAHI